MRGERITSEDRDNPGGTGIPPPFLYLGALLLGLVLHVVYPRRFLPAKISRSVGWPLLGGGVLLSSWIGRTMRRAGTPFLLGQPVDKLITDGRFCLSRNPGYLSFAMIQGGLACLANALWGAVPVPSTSTGIRRRAI